MTLPNLMQNEVLDHALWFIVNQVFESNAAVKSRDESGNAQKHVLLTVGRSWDYEAIDEDRYFNLLKSALTELAKPAES